MATLYVRGADGNDADNGTTWALAKDTVVGALAAAAAGDVVAIDSAHTESSASNFSLSIPGSGSATTTLVSVNSSGDPQPPTATLAGALIETTGAGILGISSATVSGAARIVGLTLAAGDGGNAARLECTVAARGKLIFENCVLWSRGNAAAARVQLQNTNATSGGYWLRNTQIRVANAGSAVRVTGAHLVWDGGGLHASGAALTNLFELGFNSMHVIRASGLDLTTGATAMNVCNATGVNASWDVVLRRCRMPVGWTGRPAPAGILSQSRIEMHDCPVGAGLIHTWILAYEGEIRDEQTIKVGDLSYRMTTDTTGSPDCPLRGREFAVEVAGGASRTIEMEIITDNITLTNRNFWIEIGYKDASGNWQNATSEISDMWATPTNIPTSTESWTTTGLTTPVKQKVSVTFTPGDAQFVSVTPFLGRTSTTVYVDVPAVV